MRAGLHTGSELVEAVFSRVSLKAWNPSTDMVLIPQLCFDEAMFGWKCEASGLPADRYNRDSNARICNRLISTIMHLKFCLQLLKFCYWD